MTKTIWHKGKPPHVGWWMIKAFGLKQSWSWFDGEKWGGFVWCTHNSEIAEIITNSYEFPIGFFEWCNYWPENARVPRINPNEPKERESE